MSTTCKSYLSCSEAARLMGVSRSSVQRYCEQGELRSHTTVGGHRRIDAEDVTRWLKGQTNKVRKKRRKNVDDSRFTPSYVADLLLSGKTLKLSPIIDPVTLGIQSAGWLIDNFLSPAMGEVGSRWARQQITYIDERRASTNLKLLYRQILQSRKPAEHVLRAIGASMEGDHSDLASLAMELVALESGFEAFHVGTNLPCRTLVEIALQIEASLVWVSYSHIQSIDEAIEQNQLMCELLSDQIPLVIGGGALTKNILSQLDYNYHGSNCQEFAAILDEVKQTMSEIELSSSGNPKDD